MDKGNIDSRYPAMFQRGGEQPPHGVIHPADEDDMAGGNTDEPRRPGEIAVAAREPVAESLDGLPVEDDGSVVQARWSARSWFLGIGASLLTLAAGIFCVVARVVIPGADKGVPDERSSWLMAPLGDVLMSLSPYVVVTGLGMIAVMLIVGAPHYPRQSWWLRGGAILVALVALAGAGLALFATTLHPEIMFAVDDPVTAEYPYPWTTLASIFTIPLAVLGLAVLAAVTIVHPERERENSLSGTAAFIVGIVLLGGAAVMLFAPQIFPHSMVAKTVDLNGQEFTPTPWPWTLTGAGPAMVFVGCAAMMCSAFILATRQRVFPRTCEKAWVPDGGVVCHESVMQEESTGVHR